MSSKLPKRSVLSYLWYSKGRHGIHSPFVFNLVDACLTTKLDKNFRSERKKFIEKLAKDRELFEINDLGAGSAQMKKMRSVAKIAKNAGSRGIYGTILYQLSTYFKPQTTLELGTSVGIGTFHLHKGNPKGLIISVEGCDKTMRKAEKYLWESDIENISLVNIDFDTFLKRNSCFNYDMVYIDGNHKGEKLISYLKLLNSQTHENTLFILDDIRWSKNMWQAWQKIISDQHFHLTIDLGRMGLVWKRPQQRKEHFVLRPKIFKTRFF